MRTIKLDQAYKWVTEFTVTGTGHFPIDMLRYDGPCCPASSEDWDKATADRDTIFAEDWYKKPRTVHMRRYGCNKGHGPTVARWASFGWRVE